jgi:hypothetical protein
MDDKITFKRAEMQHNLGNYSEAAKLYGELTNSNEFFLASSLRIASLSKTDRDDSGYALVWQTGSHEKGSIVRRMLRHAPVILEVDDSTPKYQKIYKNMIVVDHRINSIESIQYYLKCKRSGSNIILIHLADENFQDFHEVYMLCDLVFRNYWGELLAEKRDTYFFPLGDDSGESHTDIDRERPARQRQFDWNFLGDNTKNDRSLALNQFDLVGVGKKHLVKDFFDTRKLSPREYRRILSDSRFTLSPMGFSNCDTFRFWEAIEFGSIPIFANTNKFYFHNLLGADLPFPVFSDWETASAWLKSMLSLPGLIENIQSEMIAWWENYKNHLPIKFVQALSRKRKFKSSV